MKIRLSISLLLTVILIGLLSCTKAGDTDTALDIPEASSSALLGITEDFGQEYIDSLIFVGESTTYHLKSRGILKDGKETKQVWMPKNGTLNLDMTTKNAMIVYPETNELLSISEAAKRSKPKYIVFTFGLNGAVQNIKKGADYYKVCYRALINSVREASPSTKIILQSAPPIARNMDVSNYSVSLEELNRYIRQINAWTLEIAEEEGLGYLDSASVLRDGDGFLRDEFQNGDGHHLTYEAYKEMLYYIRTHGCK